MVALRTPRPRQLTHDEELVALRLLTDRRDELAYLRVHTVNRLHRLLTELIPGAPNGTCPRCGPSGSWRR